MAEVGPEVIGAMQVKLGLPTDTPPAKVLAAFESEAIRRAGRAGLPWNATFAQIEAAEKVQASAAAARRVAASAMLGHPVPEPVVEKYDPACEPVAGRVQQNTSGSIDWAAILADEAA